MPIEAFSFNLHDMHKANTCIDLIFTNMNSSVQGAIFTAVSHHHLTYAAFKDTKVIGQSTSFKDI